MAGSGVNPVVNGMATAADWMSAAHFCQWPELLLFLDVTDQCILWDGPVVMFFWHYF